MADIEIASEKTALATDDKLVSVINKLDESNKLSAEAIISSKETSDEAKATAQATIDAITTGHSDGSEKPHGDTAKHHGFLEGHFGWMKKEAERAAKYAKLGMGKVSDFGKAGAAKVERFAKNILDLLLKGLGLAALWALFKWASEADWEGILKEAKVWWEKIKVAWGKFEKSLDIVLDWILNIDETIKKWQEQWITMEGYLHDMWTVMKFVSGWFLAAKLIEYGTILFGKKSFIRIILRDLLRIFGPKSTLGITVGKFLKVSFFKLFGWVTSPLGKLIRNIKSVFGAESALANRAKDAKRIRDFKMFGPNSAIARLLNFFRGTRTELKMIPGLSTGKAVAVTESPVVRIYKAIKAYFAESKFLAGILKDIKGTTTFTVLFGEGSAIRGIITWMGGLFGSGGTSAFGKALLWIKESKVLMGVVKFLGVIGTKVLGIMNPIIWLIAAYDAIFGEGGFMTEFNKQEGSLWTKTLAGLAGALKRLVDFFVFDLMELFEKGVKWAMEKVLGFFGYSEEEIKKMPWYNFKFTAHLKKIFGDAIDLIKGILTMDPEVIKKAITGLWGAYTGFVDWVFNLVLKSPLNWIAKNIFKIKEDELMGSDFSVTGWIKEKLIDPIWAIFKKIFDFDYTGFIKNNAFLYWLARRAGVLPETREEIQEDIAENKAMLEEAQKGKRTKTRTGWSYDASKIDKERVAELQREQLKLQTELELTPETIKKELSEEQKAEREQGYTEADAEQYLAPAATAIIKAIKLADKNLAPPGQEDAYGGYSSYVDASQKSAIYPETNTLIPIPVKDQASQKYMYVGRRRVKVSG